MAVDHLQAVIVRVTIDGKEVVTEAMGESMTGVPATEDMHFRNGASRRQALDLATGHPE